MLEKHLQYNWWKYLLILLISTFVWCSVFTALAQPADNERLRILFVGDGLDCRALERDIDQLLPTLTEQYVLQIKVTQTMLQGQEAFRILEARTYEYDIIIISQSCMQENMGALFSGAETNVSCQYFKGVILEPGTGGFSSYYAGTEVCYLFPSPHCVNLDTRNGLGEPGDDCALKIMEYLTDGTQEVKTQWQSAD